MSALGKVKTAARATGRGAVDGHEVGSGWGERVSPADGGGGKRTIRGSLTELEAPRLQGVHVWLGSGAGQVEAHGESGSGEGRGGEDTGG